MNYLTDRFPGYKFSIIPTRQPFIICRPDEDTILCPEDDCGSIEDEVKILRLMVTMLIDDAITGHVITDE